MKNKKLHLTITFLFFIVASIYSTSTFAQPPRGGFGFSDFDNVPIETDNVDSRDYVMTNDGKIIYGDKVKWTNGRMLNNKIKVDGTVYEDKELKAYRMDGKLLFRIDDNKVARFAPKRKFGKLNVYVYSYGVVMSQNKYARPDYYVYICYIQRGDKGEIIKFDVQDDIKDFIKDCPKAYAMIDISPKELKKALKNNKRYLNEVLETYVSSACNTYTANQAK